MADNNVIVEFGAKIEGLLSGITDAKNAIGNFATTATEAFAAAFSLHEINQFIERMTELNVQTERASAILGVSTSAISGLDIMAKSTGSSIEGMSMAIARMGRNLALAESNDLSPANQALKSLGISVKEFIALPTESKLETLADRFSQLRDGTEKDAIATTLLSRAGMQMIPTFNLGSAAMREFQQIAERSGSKSFPEFEAAAHELHLQTIELGKSFDGLGMRVLSVLQPAFSGFYKIMIDVVEQFTKSIAEGGAVGVMMQTLAVAAQSLATALVISVKAVETLWEVVKTAVHAMGEMFMALGRIIKDVFTFNWSDMGAAWDNMLTQMRARAGITATNMESIFQRSVDQLKTIWQSGADAHIKIEQTKNAHLALINGAGISERVKLAQLEYKLKTEQINAEFGSFWFSEGAKTAALLDALNTRYKAELAAGERTNIAYAKFAADRQKIINEANKVYEASLNNMFQGIQTAFNSQLRGMLAGTTSFANASKAIMGDMIIWMIEEIEKMAFQWLAHEVFKTTATTVGVAERTAAEASGASAGVALEIPGIIKSIFNSAAQTFAGVFAFLSPLMGPAAAGPATASGAVVAGMAGGIAGLDVGTDFVTRTGLAVVHHGEAVVPAQTSGPFTGASAANITLNIGAIDAKSFSNLVNSNPSIFTGLIRKALRDNTLQLQTVK